MFTVASHRFIPGLGYARACSRYFHGRERRAIVGLRRCAAYPTYHYTFD